MTHLREEESMGKLEGKIALVTGGSSGIRLATAKQFVNEGAYVFLDKLPRGGQADPAAAAGNQCNLPFEFAHRIPTNRFFCWSRAVPDGLV